MGREEIILTDCSRYGRYWAFDFKKKDFRRADEGEESPNFVDKGFARKFTYGGVLGAFEQQGRSFLVMRGAVFFVVEGGCIRKGSQREFLYHINYILRQFSEKVF